MKTRQVQPRRASAAISQMATAAIPERKQVICQPAKSAALMAAPPVEKSTAAAASWRRARAGADMGRTYTAPARRVSARARPGTYRVNRSMSPWRRAGSHRRARAVASRRRLAGHRDLVAHHVLDVKELDRHQHCG